MLVWAVPISAEAIGLCCRPHRLDNYCFQCKSQLKNVDFRQSQNAV